MSNEPVSTLALGIVLTCIGCLSLDMRAYCYGSAVIFFGLLFILANMIGGNK